MTIGPVETFGKEIINTKKTGDVIEIDFGGKTAKVKTQDIKAKNGIIHEVDTILLSPETPETPGNLIEVLEKAATFTKLIEALTKVELTEKLKTIVLATIFAPNDDAFKTLPDDEDLKKIIER